jgi:uncharacterized FAD-dependent dehydrogenase
MHDVVVVGAGPAGLAAGTAARMLGADTLIIEQGKMLDNRSQIDRIDVVSGIGGAGLYSDGKFSFYPSATALWSIEPKHVLADGYNWLTEMLAITDIRVPAFPSRPLERLALEGGGIRRKEYPSFYLPAEQRKNMLVGLADGIAEFLYPMCGVAKVEHHPDGYIVIKGEGDRIIANARRVVLALGRFGSLMLQRSLTSEDLVFRRVELGVRIEQPADTFFLSGDRCLDPKVLGNKTVGHGWRTFCCCRDGLVVFSSSVGLSSVSGRADCPPSGRSNVGLLIRYTDHRAGMAAWRDAVQVQPITEPTVERLCDLMDRRGEVRPTSRVAQILGGHTARHLVEALHDLSHFTGRPLAEATVHAPAIEGVGLYPRIGSDLKIPGRPMFIAGDATGIFRGLTAALVSGFVAGSAAALSATTSLG